MIHGHARKGRTSSEYYTWRAMIARCENPNNKDFDAYGGRGIRVCARWRRSFSAFLDDMGRRPSPDHSIERRNNNSGYTPQNCYWATRQEPNHNRRDNIVVEICGVHRTAMQWCSFFRLSRDTYKYRLRRGLSRLEALTTPVKR